ncbi:hypothetical protein TSAR_004303, partial [Trichomalopsis sarcophagae]
MKKQVRATEQWLLLGAFEGPRKQCHKALFECWNMVLHCSKHILSENNCKRPSNENFNNCFDGLNVIALLQAEMLSRQVGAAL